MPANQSYARLGLFVVLTAMVALATAAFFVQRVRSRAVLEMVTYTSENVSGLDISSPVRFRGVSIGRVADVRVDPRGNNVQIDFQLFLDRLNTIGANVNRIRRLNDLGGTAARLRARVVSNPVTGEAYLLLDVPDNPPPPIALPFTPTRTYVPAMPSMMSTVQDRLPALMERAEAILGTLREIGAKIPDTLDRSNQFFTNLDRIFKESELPALSADSRKFFATTTAQLATATAQIERMTNELDALIGTRGTLVTLTDQVRETLKIADLPATTRSSREAMEQTSLATDDLRRSLPAIRDSLAELRELARQLQEQPESVVYGRRPAGKEQ